jgi:uncharacterized protein YndB with AHSA1/START domain
MTEDTDRIERQIVMNAPRSRVWQALSRAEEFGDWFGAALKGQVMAPGRRVQGPITISGYEHVQFDVTIERMEPESLLSFRWHPYAVEPNIDYSNEPTTLVTFELSEVEGGTLLKVVEAGFDGIPLPRRFTAYRMNSAGWEGQLRNIERHVGSGR